MWCSDWNSNGRVQDKQARKQASKEARKPEKLHTSTKQTIRGMVVSQKGYEIRNVRIRSMAMTSWTSSESTERCQCSSHRNTGIVPSIDFGYTEFGIV